MKFTKTALAAEIAISVIILVVVEWLSSTLTHTGNFWTLMLVWGAYLGVRVAMWTKKPRAHSSSVTKGGA